MCGIAGIIDSSTRDSESVRASVDRMSRAIAHRGPDDEGIEMLGATPNAVFAHRRLAILDLSAAGHQPMRSSDGRYWIVFNGEIYNYRELRAELEAKGAHLRSTSDTEVLVELFARDGAECLQKLRGMFAFAIWDRETRQLFLARDRFGIKPLYYAVPNPKLILIASEIQAIRQSGLVTDKTDKESEMEFLQRGSIAAPRTFYRDVKSLPPAHFAIWSDGKLLINPYWSMEKSLESSPRSDTDVGEAAERVRAALIESVKAHMVSDVPVGVFLSGGLDSTAIVAAVRQFHRGPLRTFSIVFPKTQWDEGNLARAAANHYGTDHTELEVTQKDFLDGLENALSAMDQPTIDGVNTYFVAKAARAAGGKVALSGLGGDEILGGYASFVEVPRLQKILQRANRVPAAAKLASRFAKYIPSSRSPKLARLLRANADDLAAIWREYRALFTDEQIRELGHTPFVPGRDEPPARPLDVSDARGRASLPSFWSIARLEIERFMIPQLLRDSDVFTMCHSLELRTPFVDHEFLRAVVSAGNWSRGRAASHKIALFRAMKGFLPEEHLRQPKRGFVFPFEVWLRGAFSKNEMRVELENAGHQKWVNRFLQGKVHWSRVWALYVLERFRNGTIGHRR